MIDDFMTTEALLDKTKAFALANGYRLDKQGVKFEPQTNETYLKETFLGNDTDPLGLAAESSDRQDPIYQIDVFTPKDQGGPWEARVVVNLLKLEFQRASFILDNAAQKVQISNVSAREMPANDTHNWSSVSIDLVVIASNT